VETAQPLLISGKFGVSGMLSYLYSLLLLLLLVLTAVAAGVLLTSQGS
jgi:hypothetical protein